MSSEPTIPDESTAALRRRGLRLEWATNCWNAVEVVVTLTLGIRARSLALVAFGLDSVVEIFASTVVIRSLHDERADPGDRRVHRSLRLIAIAFWLLAAFLVVVATRSLLRGDRPDDSPVGVWFLAVTALTMLGLARLKHVTADRSGSEPLRAEAGMTYLDACLSFGILVALVLNSSLGWWWADAVAALLVAAVAIDEGVRHWLGSAPHPDGASPAPARSRATSGSRRRGCGP
jgi:divalent metal cation (Fe/Co/Zn/Cd) transporter